MNKTKTIILLVIGILVVTISSIGITYSFMLPKADKTNNQTEIGINNCAKITLKDNNSTINLENMYPMEEEMGLQTEAYEFTISSTCEEYTGFNLYLLTYSDNGIAGDLIRYGITSKNDTVLKTNLLTSTVEETELTEAEKKEINQGVNKGYNKIYKVYSNNIPLKGESEYKLHIWLDENADNETMGKSIKLGVIVKGYQREETMAEYLIAHKDNTLIYHDGKPDYDGMVNADLEAEDYNYRYSGGNDVVNNYVCFGGECSNDPTSDNYSNLYRIIGLFKNEQNEYEMKIIKSDYATAEELGGETIGAYNGIYSYSSSNYKGDKSNYFSKIASYYWNNNTDNSNWSQSNLNTVNLNYYYLKYIQGKETDEWGEMIKDHKWITSGIFDSYIYSYNAKMLYENEVKKPSSSTTNNAKVGLMYINDYMYSASKEYWVEVGFDPNFVNDYRLAINDNWLYMGLSEWTITRRNDPSNFVFRVTAGIDSIHASDKYANSGIAVRPTMYLNSNVKIIDGDGTSKKPYKLSI